MLTIITGRGKSGKTRRLLEAVRTCPSAEMASKIVIVPEQLSHETERLLSLLCGDTISFSAEVLSFSRLYDRVTARSGGGAMSILDQGGRILTARQALEGIRPRLKVFGSAAGKPEFLGSMVGMIDELKSYGVSAAALQQTAQATSGLFAEKLSELALILGAYEAATAQGQADPRDRLTLLRKKLLDGDYAQGRHFFVDGFTDFSGLELRVLEALLRRGESLTVTLPAGDDPAQPGVFLPGAETMAVLSELCRSLGQELRVLPAAYHRPLPPALTYLEQHLMDYAADGFTEPQTAVQVLLPADLLEECRACGAVLKRKAMEGMRFRDMAVCCGDENAYRALLPAVLESLGIPVYRSEKRQVLAHPVARFLLLALECATGGMEQEAVMAYLKTGYPGLDRDQVDLLENYCVTWSIRGSKFFSEWKLHPDGYDGVFREETEVLLQNLNDWRKAAMEPLQQLSLRLRDALTVREQLEAVYDFMTAARLYARLEQQVAEETANGQLEAAQETAQIWSILLTCLQQTAQVLGTLRLKGQELGKMLELALGQYQVGTIPAVLDAVSIGSVSSMRGKEPKLLYVLGVTESAMPAAPAGGSLLSEQERQTLRQQFDIQLAPDSEGNLQRQLLELYTAFTAPTQALYLSCPADAEGGVSFLLERIMQLFPDCTGQAPVDTGYTPQTAAELCLTASEDDRTRPLSAAISAAARQLPALSQAILLGQRWAEPRDTMVSREVARRLFGSTVGLTASRLDKFASCPLDFFLTFGLKARPRKEATFNAAEFGTFVHFILEKSVPTLASDRRIYTPEESLQLVDRHMDEYVEDRLGPMEQTNRQHYLLYRNRVEAALLVEEISEELSTTDFVPCGYEISLGGKDGLPPLTVKSQLGRGALSGFVDRADLWRSPNGDFLRIVDYKTGSKKFDYTDLYGGAGMQMLLYLFALEQSGLPGISDRPKPAGVLYFPAKRSFSSADGPEDGESAHAPVQRSGIILSEDGVPEAMEHGDSYQYIPVKKTKSGMGDYVVSSQQLRLLKDYVEDRMTQVTDRILGGEFPARPFYRGQSHDPCAWCDFGAVCQKDPQFRKTCYQASIKPGEFWAFLSEGGENHG